MWWALFFLPWMVSATAQAQTVLARDCQTTPCSFRADIPPGSPPIASCRLYNGAITIIAEVPPTGTTACDFPNVTLVWGMYRLTARTVGAAGQSSPDSNFIDLNSGAPPPPPPPPPPLLPPTGFRVI